MYIPGYYKNTDLDEIREFIQKNSFGLLISTGNPKIEATHIPIELTINDKGEEVLQGHISRGNIQRKAIKNGADVLAVFSGPHAYVSSSWYDHENVPTWNYIAVHVYGKLRLLTDDELYSSLKKLVDKYEQHSEKPLKLEALDPELVKSEMRGVVGFEMSIDEVQAAYKLSQGHDDKNHRSIVDQLTKRGAESDLDIAGEMSTRRGKREPHK